MSDITEKLALIQQARDDIKDALAEKGQIVGKDIRDYAEAVANIEGGSGDNTYKMYNSIEQMKADTSLKLGDICLIVNREIANAQRDTILDNVYIPETFTLNDTNDMNGPDFRYTLVSGEVSVSYRINGTNAEIDIMNYVRDGVGFNYNFSYTSTDGLTFTLKDGQSQIIKLPHFVKLAKEELKDTDMK